MVSIMEYIVTRLGTTALGELSWDAPGWESLPTAELCCFLGVRPHHFPKTQVKLGYDESSLTLLFKVEDRHVRAVATRHQQSVCGDSCVEFFFTTCPDCNSGYFNMEINCGGTMLFHYHPRSTREEAISLPEAVCEQISCHHSLPRIVEPEIEDPVTWMLSAHIPLEVLDYYSRPVQPRLGVAWRCNFYKCADASSQPHWLSWAPVLVSRPDFHRPEFFGRLIFS